jgi:hypothetical protein
MFPFSLPLGQSVSPPRPFSRPKFPLRSGRRRRLLAWPLAPEAAERPSNETSPHTLSECIRQAQKRIRQKGNRIRENGSSIHTNTTSKQTNPTCKRQNAFVIRVLPSRILNAYAGCAGGTRGARGGKRTIDPQMTPIFADSDRVF